MNNAYPTPMRSTRWWITCLTLMLCATLNAQNRVEYFWNTDPGIGKGYNKVYVNSGTVNFDIDTEELPVGPNLLGIRVIDGDYSSPTLLRTIFKVALFEDNAKVEYFWDTDPGIGNATAYPIGLGGKEVAISLSLPTSDVTNGVHLLGLRVYNGCWSHTRHYIVVVNNNGGIEQVEYFWDTDPGVGNAHQYELPSNNNGMVSLDIPTDTLSTGIHMLGMRAFCGQWSSTTLRYVAISATDGEIERIEYFWDADPGIGNAHQYKLPSNNNGMVSLEIPTDTLSTGIHLLGMRALHGQWSNTTLRYVATSATDGKIERVEYYWNDDPGYGKGTELPFTDGTLSVVDTDIAAPSESGIHILHIRAYANGLWSIPYIQKVQMNATLVTELSTRDIQISVAREGLRVKNACGTTLTLTDTNGKLIMTEILSNENQLIPLSSLSSGIHVVKIESKGTPVVLKFLWK